MNNKLLVLWDNNSNDSLATACNFTGFGINASTLRYQVPAFGQQHTFYGGTSNLMTISSNVGIGTATPGYTLEVAGAIYASGDITTLSDSRYKTNITSLSNSLNNICMLNGYSYTRTDYDQLKEDKDIKHIG